MVGSPPDNCSISTLPFFSITRSMRFLIAFKGTEAGPLFDKGELAKHVGQLKLQESTISIKAMHVDNVSNIPGSELIALLPRDAQQLPSAEQHESWSGVRGS